jgi:DNA-3-methyladenine glycosylase II
MSELVISARAPFDFAATARFLRFTDAEVVDTFAGGRYARAIHFGERLFLLSAESHGTPARPAVRLALAPEQFVTPQISDAATRLARDMFSLEHDLAGWGALLARDAVMRRLEAAHRGLRLPRWPSLFEALVTSILLQQIATSVAITFRRRVVERFGECLETGGETYRAFPRAEALARASVAELRALGLSNAKATCIIEVARACAAGELSSERLAGEDNESVVARLSELRGIGRWTAEWVLMLHFGRMDVFPAADLFLRGVVVKYYNRGAQMNEREIRAFAAKRWRGFESYSALYFLAGMRAGTITLKPERVLSSDEREARPTTRGRRKTTDRQDET